MCVKIVLSDWPERLIREVERSGDCREHLDGIHGAIRAARLETDDAATHATLDAAEACIESLYGEVEKPQPRRSTMIAESRELARILTRCGL